MKILQLCKKFPFPLKDGESIAVTYLSKAMADLGCDMTLLSINTAKHFTDIDDLPESFNHYSAVHTVHLDNGVNTWDAFKNLFSRKSYHISRFESDAFRDKLISLLQEEDFDVIQLETLYLGPYVDVIRQYSNALVVMRAHNVEHEIWERLQTNVKFLPKRWYLKYLTTKLKRFEIETLEDYDFLVPISDVDLSKFRSLGYSNGAKAIPIGLDLDGYEPKPLNIHRPYSMSFIGSLDWMPNLEGLEWFLDNVWPSLSAEFGDLQFHVAGRNAPQELLDSSKDNLLIHGEVDCAKEFLNDHQIMVVPLLSGSGMRAKIIEAMALGRIVVTTSLGLEGIPAKDRHEVFVADTAEQFLEVMQIIHSDPRILFDMSAAAKNFVHEHYSHDRLARKFHDSLVDYRQKRLKSESVPA